jgi:hypothetical protein
MANIGATIEEKLSLQEKESKISYLPTMTNPLQKSRKNSKNGML